MADKHEMQADGVSPILIDRVIRLRDAYNVWVNSPNKRKKELVDYITGRYKISARSAYDDLKLVEYMLGSLNESSKSFHRMRFNEGILEAIELAKKNDDIKALVQGWKTYAQFNKLDQEDIQEIMWDERELQPFVITSDPSELGVKKIPNIVTKVQSMMKRYSDHIEDVTYEELELEVGLEEIKEEEEVEQDE